MYNNIYIYIYLHQKNMLYTLTTSAFDLNTKVWRLTSMGNLNHRLTVSLLGFPSIPSLIRCVPPGTGRWLAHLSLHQSVTLEIWKVAKRKIRQDVHIYKYKDITWMKQSSDFKLCKL